MFEESGFKSDIGRYLVTQLVNHIFNDDMAKFRSFVYDAVHADQQKRRAISALWGTFRTHGVMQKYLGYNIEHHLSIASEYVKFLVLNNDNGSNSEELKAKIVELEVKVSEASTIATTTRYKHSQILDGLT